MGAVDAGKGKTRLQAAKEQAIEQIETLHGRGLFASGGGRTMVIAFDDTAQVVAPFTDSRRQLVDAVASIVQTDGRSSIGEALSLSTIAEATGDLDKAIQMLLLSKYWTTQGALGKLRNWRAETLG